MIDGRRGRPKSTAPSADTQANGQVSPPASPSKRPRFALGARLHKHGITADQITVLGVVLAAAAGASIAVGWFVLATGLIIVGGLMDALDGAVAKAAGATSKRGAFFDSTTDRVADGFIFGGAAWYFARGHHPLLAILPFAILAAGNIVSYERAKAESLGFVAKGGMMERAERLIWLGTTLMFSWVWPPLLVPALIGLLALTVFTVGQRFVKVWRQATAEMRGVPEPVVAVPRWRPARVESRWRAWREASLAAAGSTGVRKARVATKPTSRVRVRREMEPIATRVRRALQAERSGRTSVRSGRPARQTTAKARWSTGGALRKRYDSSR